MPMVNKKTDLFIQKAKDVHGNKYDYNDVIYLSAKTKVILRCKIHGTFEQTPTNHLSGKGCKKCSIENRSKLFKTSQENYIKQVRAVHGARYDLSQIKYINAHTNIKVICHKHGAFSPSPQRFKKGSNCPKCNSESKTDKSIYIREDIITEFIKIHGDQYDYSKVIYKTKGKKVIFFCKKHGEFLQSPKQHIKGAGCPHCSGNVRFTTKTFLKELKNRGYWNNNYDYSQVEYVSAKKLIRVKDKSTETYHLANPYTMLNRGSKLDISNAEDKTKYTKTLMITQKLNT